MTPSTRVVGDMFFSWAAPTTVKGTGEFTPVWRRCEPVMTTSWTLVSFDALAAFEPFAASAACAIAAGEAATMSAISNVRPLFRVIAHFPRVLAHVRALLDPVPPETNPWHPRAKAC